MNNSYPYYEMKSDGVTLNPIFNCAISNTDIQNYIADPTPGNPFLDIICYMEADELDLYYSGVSFQVNVPSTSCSYIQVDLPWYYTYPVGTGAAVSSYVMNETLPVPAPSDVVNSVQGTAFCPFDFSKWSLPVGVPSTMPQPAINPGPNCCFGNYQQVVTTITPNASPSPALPVITESTTNGTWGGQASDCAAGPAFDVGLKDKSGFPAPTIAEIAGTGVNTKFTIPSPLSKQFVSNVYAANYFTSTNYDSVKAAGVGYMPAAIVPALNSSAITAWPPSSTGASVAAPANPNPYYTFTCYDEGKEVLARIRVMVRSWDTVSSNWLTTTGLGASVYTANTSCNTAVLPPGTPCPDPFHDFGIWDDIFPFVSGSNVPNASYTNQFSGTSYTGYTQGYPLSGQ